MDDARQRGTSAACVLLFALLLGFFLVKPVSAQAPVSNEYQVKAVFLYNFTQFVDWPPSAFSGADAPLTIGILGNDPFGDILDEIVREESVGGHKLAVRRYQRPEDVEGCQILFVSDKIPDVEKWFSEWRWRHILVVSDAEDFARRGGTIGFSTIDKKIRLTVNLQAAKASGLTIRSQLLRAVELVGIEEGKP